MAQTTLGDGLIIGAGDHITFGDSTVLASSPNGFKNKIIGGDFTTNPWQRGTSFTTLNGYCADRWEGALATMTGAVTGLKTADAPTVAEAGVFTQHCLHIDVTTADAALAAGDLYIVRQRIEGYNAACFGFGQTGTRYVTLSFWHKHTKIGTYCASFINSASNRSYVAEYTQAVTDTWEKAVITIPVDTTGTWLYDSGVGVQVSFALMSGSTFNTTANTWAAGLYFATSNQVNALDSTANNFKIALVQLESGSVATPFETRSIGTELALCQRYYEKSFPMATTPAQNAGVTGAWLGVQAAAASTLMYVGQVKFATTKRATPTTITLYNPAAANAQLRNLSASSDWSATTVSVSGDSGFSIYGTSAGGSSAGNGASINWTAEAEL